MIITDDNVRFTTTEAGASRFLGVLAGDPQFDGAGAIIGQRFGAIIRATDYDQPRSSARPSPTRS